MHQVNLRYWLNVNTGEVIDTYYDSLTDFRRRTQNWPHILVAISFEVFSKIAPRKYIEGLSPKEPYTSHLRYP